MSRLLAALAPCLLFAAFGASPVAAQEASASGTSAVPDLDDIEAAADRGDVAEARAALAAYVNAAGERGTPGRARSARFDYLAGRLSEDPDSAEIAFLRAAIDGTGPYAARARLRLAQLELARADHARAAEHLERLRSDDPAGELVPVSWLWTARVAESAGEVTRACAAWSEALAAVPADHPTRREAREGRSRCEEGARQPGEVETFTVQLGAFGSEDAALRLRDGAASLGVAVRVESPSGGVRVFRVRAGRFGSRSDAERLAERFRAEDYEAIVVPEEP